jgi:hypothetical protein
MTVGLLRERAVRVRVLAKRGARAASSRTAFANAEKIGYVRRWQESQMSARKFERENALAQSSIAKWQVQMPLLRCADQRLLRKARRSPKLESALKRWVLEHNRVTRLLGTDRPPDGDKATWTGTMA